MSGPKTSRFTLTEEQRRQLAIQREREIKRQAEKKKLSQIRIAISDAAGGLEHEASRAAELQARENNDCGWSAGLMRLQTEIQKAEHAIAAVKADASLEEYEQANMRAKQAAEKITALRAELINIDHQVALHLDKSVAIDVDKGFSVSFSFASTKDEAECKDKAQACLLQLLALRKMNLSVELFEQIDRALACLEDISGSSYLKSFQAVTIDPLKRKCVKYAETQKEVSDRYQELIPVYETLCEQAGLIPDRFTATAASVKFLETEIERVRSLVSEMEEQAYISQCVDEAMSELGYELIGDRMVTKRSGKRFRNELYLFAEGTAVNVTYASDGRITMELGGMDQVDRAPTSTEAERMRSDMEHFCGEYHQLEKLLAKKGVVTQHISLLPPSEECAMIINTSDYNMTSTAPEAKRQTRKKAEGKLRRSV